MCVQKARLPLMLCAADDASLRKFAADVQMVLTNAAVH